MLGNFDLCTFKIQLVCLIELDQRKFIVFNRHRIFKPKTGENTISKVLIKLCYNNECSSLYHTKLIVACHFIHFSHCSG